MKTIGILFLFLLSLSLFTGCGRTGEGIAKDTIYQIQQDGVLWKTYDVWLTNDHPTEHYSAIYCPEPNDKETIRKLKEAVMTKGKCTIAYHNEMVVSYSRCNSNTIIDNVTCE